MMSTLRNKKRLLNKDLSPEQKAQQEQKAQERAEMMALQKQSMMIKMESDMAQARKNNSDADSQDLENQVVIQSYDGLQLKQEAETAGKFADAEMKRNKAFQTNVETGLLLTSPPPNKVAVI